MAAMIKAPIFITLSIILYIIDMLHFLHNIKKE